MCVYIRRARLSGTYCLEFSLEFLPDEEDWTKQACGSDGADYVHLSSHTLAASATKSMSLLKDDLTVVAVQGTLYKILGYTLSVQHQANVYIECNAC